jgi:hypothetical protein
MLDSDVSPVLIQWLTLQNIDISIAAPRHKAWGDFAIIPPCIGFNCNTASFYPHQLIPDNFTEGLTQWAECFRQETLPWLIEKKMPIFAAGNGAFMVLQHLNFKLVASNGDISLNENKEVFYLGKDIPNWLYLCPDNLNHFHLTKAIEHFKALKTPPSSAIGVLEENPAPIAPVVLKKKL